MSAKVLVIAASKGREYRTDRASAEKKVARGAYRWRDKFTIEEIDARFRVPLYDGLLGTGNAIPFSRTQNRLRAPHKLHYEIPAAGAHVRIMRCALINSVGRNNGTQSGVEGGRGESPECWSETTAGNGRSQSTGAIGNRNALTL